MATRKLKTDRRVVRQEARLMIVDIHRFLKAENEFTKTYKYCSCDLSHYNKIMQRTADAAGISVKTTLRIIREDKERQKASEEEREQGEQSSEEDDAGEGCSSKT